MFAIRWRTNSSNPMCYIACVAVAAAQNGAFFLSPCIPTIPNGSLTTYSSRRTIIFFSSKPQIRSWTRCSNVSLIEEGRGPGGIRSPDLIDLEYKDLNLKEKLGHVGHVRIRQHVNPLSSSFSVPCQVPNWNEVFKDSTLPLMVDIGSGSGRFLIWLAKRFSESRNYLGLEIRQKLVKRAEFWVDELALKNIYFMFANAAVSFDQLVATYPGPLMMVSVLCPDPHFKKRHHKRRVVQKPLVNSITRNLRPGGQVFLQSDVLQVALDMRMQFDALSDSFKHVDHLDLSILCDDEGWLLSNPMGIRTEREIHAELEGGRVYRRMYQKQGSDP